MDEESIRMLLKADKNTARELHEAAEFELFITMQKELRELVIEYGITLPLKSLQFLYYEDRFLYRYARY